MGLEVKYGGVNIGKYINVLKGFTPFSGPDWDVSLSDDGMRRGSEFEYITYKHKIIPMPFEISGDILEKYDKLCAALNVDEPKELIFSSVPDRMFYAVPSGDFDFDQISVFGSGTINWIVVDGVAHSTTEKTFQASENASGVLEATVTNSGTESVPMSYDITHHHENGFIGIVSEYGILQYGSVDEADDEAREKSEVLLKYTKPSDYSAMTEGKGILASNDTFPMTGKFTGYEDGWLRLQSSGSGSSWHGAARQVTLPADSSGNSGAVNFVAQTKIWFETSDASQDGLLEFVVGDTDGNHLASIHLVKGVGTAECTPIFQVQAKEKGRISYVPNSNSVTNRNNGNMEIRKSGELFEFLFGGKTYPYRVPEAKDKKALTLTIFIGQYANRANPVNQMAFGTMSFRKDNVQYRVDIPNRYAEGDVITIDGETTKMYVNGVPALGDEVKGSKHFHVPPGETKIQFYFSDFCNPAPDVTVRIREAYL